MRVPVHLSVEKLPSEEIAPFVGVMLEALSDINRLHLRRRFIALSDTLVRYREASASEGWLDIPAVLHSMFGSCRELCAWRVAELRERGEDARFHIVLHEAANADALYHVQVRRSDGSLEDPSRSRGARGGLWSSR